jgi:hypothetical protein
VSDQCGAHDVWQQAIDAGYENAADLRERMSPSCQRARRGRAASYPPDLPPAFNPKNMARTATDVLDNGLPALPEPLSYQMALPIARWKARHRAGSAHRREAQRPVASFLGPAASRHQRGLEGSAPAP